MLFSFSNVSISSCNIFSLFSSVFFLYGAYEIVFPLISIKRTSKNRLSSIENLISCNGNLFIFGFSACLSTAYTSLVLSITFLI